ncbi:MAG: hypothetical protein WCU74_01185 [Candidatus Omnitrophota bacterium]
MGKSFSCSPWDQNKLWLVVSGGDEEELRQIFAMRGIEALFDCGIFGSPNAKEQILLREKNCGNIIGPAVFLGDSQYDYKVATQMGLEFIFVSDWTEMRDWLEFCTQSNVPYIQSISELIVKHNRFYV